jgi:hypothetical protein
MNSLQRIGLRVIVAFVASAGIWTILYAAAPSEDPSLSTPELTRATFDVSKVTAFEIRGDADVIQLERRNNWRLLSQQEDFSADEAQVKTWLERISRMPLRPVVNPGPPELYGLLRPRLLFSIYQSNRLVGQLAVGERILMEDAFYVSRTPLPGVFSASANDILPLLQDRDVLRERRVVPIAEEKITSVTLTNSEGTFTLRREGDHFALRTDNGIDTADRRNAQSWVTALTQMQIVSFSLAGPISTATKTIQIQGDTSQVTLEIYSEESNWAKRTLTDAQGKREEDWVQLASSQALTPPLSSLQQNRLIEPIETNQVSRMKLRWGEPFLVAQQTPDGWEFMAPINGPISTTSVESLFAALFALRGTPLPMNATPDLYQLATPFAQVDLFGTAGEVLLQLQLSPPLEDGGAYAKLSTQSKIVQLSKEEVQGLALSEWIDGKD